MSDNPDDGKPPSAETLAVRALGWTDPSTRAIAPPVHTSVTYEREDDNTYGPEGRVYARRDHPAYGQVEALMAQLEGGPEALVFASGMAAATAVFHGLGPGDHIIAPQKAYYELRYWLETQGRNWGLEVDFLETMTPEAVAAAIRPTVTRLVWVETPDNPFWGLTDIAAVAQVTHQAGARLAVDSTVATPVLTRPLELGADIVMHSATKYLNGHCDLLAGVLVTAKSDDFWDRIKMVRRINGAALGGFECWLLLRGLRTLFLRVRAACAGAEAIATYLDGHDRVAEVLYPGLPGHPGHDIAARQMQGGFGGMLSFRLAGGEAAAVRVVTGLDYFSRATSLGGVESLIEHRASVEGPGTTVPRDLLRVSVGAEDQADLIADLEQALAKD